MSEAAVAEAAPAAAGGRTRGARLDGIGRWGTIIALVVLIVLFSVLKPNAFATVDNVKLILNNSAVLVLLATGLTICLAMGNFDLSIAALASLTVTFSASLIIETHVLAWVVILIAIGAGIVVGAINGLIVTYLKISALVITLGMGSILAGVDLWIANGETVYGPMPLYFLDLGRGTIAGIPNPVIIAGGVAVILWFLLTWTETGRGMLAIGGNKEAARLSGLPVQRLQVYGFILCSITATIAGLVLTAQASSGYPNAAGSYLLLAYAAAFLGSVTLRRAEFHIWGTVIGALLLGVTSNGLTIVNLPNFIAQIFSGAVLIVAVAMAALENRRS